MILACCTCVFGQNNGRIKPDIKYWYEGKLTEEDFQIRKVSDLNNKIPGNLDWHITFRDTTIRKGNLKLTYPTTTLYMDQIQSWLNPDVLQMPSLSYFQTEFNIVEFYRRKMQDEINQDPANIDEISDYNERLLRSSLESFYLETNYGTDWGALARYDAKYEEDLKNWEEAPVQEPSFLKKGFGERLYFGYYTQFYGAPMSEYLRPGTHGLIIGIAMEFSNFYVGMESVISAAGTLKADNFYYDSKYDYYWQKGLNCSNNVLAFNFGYSVLDKPTFSLAPEVGFGVNFLNQRIPKEFRVDDSSSSSEFAGPRLQAGLNFNIKLRRSYDYSYGGYGYSSTSLVFKVFGARSWFKPYGASNSINLGVCLDLNALVATY